MLINFTLLVFGRILKFYKFTNLQIYKFLKKHHLYVFSQALQLVWHASQDEPRNVQIGTHVGSARCACDGSRRALPCNARVCATQVCVSVMGVALPFVVVVLQR